MWYCCRLSRTPATPGRPPATPVSAATNIGDVSTAAVTAAAALAACNITQEQLAGLPADKAVAAGAGSEGDHGPGVGQLLFVDCELLQLHDQEALGYMLRGLKVGWLVVGSLILVTFIRACSLYASMLYDG